jgi:hypothetical protein
MSNNNENSVASQEWAAQEAAIEALYQAFAVFPLRPII